MKKSRKYILLTLLGLFTFSAWAQTNNRVRVSGDKNTRRRGMQIVVGNVHFTQGTTQVYCDSAVSFSSNKRIEAYGNVRVIDEADSLNITARQLFYNPSTRKSRLRNNVVYRGPDFTLYTDNLDYNMATKQAQYFNGGRVEDDQMKLRSIFGDFDPESDQMVFRTKVVLNDPQGTVNSDYLRYETKEGMAYFEGPTEIIGEDGNAIKNNDGAQYDTNTRQFFGMETRIEDDDFIITGDQSSFEEGYRKIVGSVNLFSKSDSVTVTGEEAIYDEANGLFTVYGKPLLQKPFGPDTLWLTADTLVSLQGDSTVDKRLMAYQNVRIFKSDLQGVADSLIYNFTDSMIYFYEKPAIWSEDTQITGDSIWLEIGQGEVKKLLTYQNSFVISQVNKRRYNQIKGRLMVTSFENNQISLLDVEGNGESVYFQVEVDSVISGMNRMVCSNMKLTFQENTISRIKFYKKPEASFVPPHEITEDQAKLEGFSWRAWERPSKDAVVLGLAPPEAPTPESEPVATETQVLPNEESRLLQNEEEG